MQIRSDYTSFHNNNHRESHTHHITECHFEEEIAKRQTGGAGPAQAAVPSSKAAEFSKDGDIYQMGLSSPVTKSDSGKGKGSPIKGFWDALGDEGAESSKNVMTVLKENIMDGIHGATHAIKGAFQFQVIDRALNVREKVRSSVQKTLKGFGRNKDTFTALTGGQTSAGKGKYNSKEKNKGQVTALKKEEDIPMKVLVHSHLMDSYNRKGEYSQLNDNLTYQKTGSVSRKQNRE